MIQFDEHIFQMGWNHQPAKFRLIEYLVVCWTCDLCIFFFQLASTLQLIHWLSHIFGDSPVHPSWGAFQLFQGSACPPKLPGFGFFMWGALWGSFEATNQPLWSNTMRGVFHENLQCQFWLPGNLEMDRNTILDANKSVLFFHCLSSFLKCQYVNRKIPCWFYSSNMKESRATKQPEISDKIRFASGWCRHWTGDWWWCNPINCWCLQGTQQKNQQIFLLVTTYYANAPCDVIRSAFFLDSFICFCHLSLTFIRMFSKSLCEVRAVWKGCYIGSTRNHLSPVRWSLPVQWSNMFFFSWQIIQWHKWTSVMVISCFKRNQFSMIIRDLTV